MLAGYGDQLGAPMKRFLVSLLTRLALTTLACAQPEPTFTPPSEPEPLASYFPNVSHDSTKLYALFRPFLGIAKADIGLVRYLVHQQ